MNPGFRTFDAAGRETFNIFMPVVRQESHLYIPAWSSGSINLTGLVDKDSAVRFIPANWGTYGFPVMPYAVRSGNYLNYQADKTACYAIITGVVR